MTGILGVAYLWVLVIICKFVEACKKPIPTLEKKSWLDTD